MKEASLPWQQVMIKIAISLREVNDMYISHLAE